MATNEATVERKSDGTAVIQLTIPKADVSNQYEKLLQAAVEQAEIKGFRKGKAPKNLVEESIGKQKLYTRSLEQLLPKAYAEAVSTLKLKPISNPRIEPKSIEEGKDWKLEVTVAEKPNFVLGNYKQAVSAALASSKIWVPGKDARAAGRTPDLKGKQSQKSIDEKIGLVLDALLGSVQITLPQIVVEDEINRLLSQLVEQIQKLGLSIDQYLASLGKTSAQLRSQYREQAERNLKLELTLNEIAQDLEVKVNETEVDQLIKAVGDEKLRRSLDTPTERASIRASLRKRKVLDQLLRL